MNSPSSSAEWEEHKKDLEVRRRFWSLGRFEIKNIKFLNDVIRKGYHRRIR